MNLFFARKMLLSAAIVPMVALAPYAGAQLKAGVARVDITPTIADLPKPFTSVYTNIYARALVLDSGGTRAVIVVGDLPMIAADVLDDLNHRIAAAVGAPVENVIVAVTHTHNAIRIDNNVRGGVLPGSPVIVKFTIDKIIDCVKEAAANLQPARAGYATGSFHLAVAHQTGAAQATSAADQNQRPATIGVFKVENAAGDTMALLVNNGPEPVMGMGMNSKISADVAGAMARYIEQRFSDKAIVLYTVGSPPQLVVNARQRIPGLTPADPAAVMNAAGVVMGEEVLSIASRVKTSSEMKLSGAATVLTCPGKATTPLNNAASCSDAPDSKLPRCVFTDHDTGPVSLKIGVVRLGDLSVVDTDSDIDSSIWAQVDNQAPSPANTMLVALTYGPMHYVVPDSVYPSNSYQATASMVKAGCAEKGFINKAVTMLNATGAK